MDFCIDRSVVGSKRHLVVKSGEIRWSETVPDELYVYGPSASPEKDLGLLVALSGTKILDTPGGPWEASMRLVLGKDYEKTEIPWAKVMPAQKWEGYARNLCDSLGEALERVGLDYFEGTYLPSESILRALKPAFIDVDKLEGYIKAENQQQQDVVKSFSCKGVANPIVYSRLTSTGRLKVVEGPEILRLKKSYRDILISRHDGGRIVSIDYVSMEPRLSLALADKEIPEDIYEHVAKHVLDGMMDRKTAKLMTLAVLYGAGIGRLSKIVDIDPATIASAKMQIKKYFGIKKLETKLINEQATTGTIRNYYGKVMKLSDPAPHKLFNAYVQSTAVDIALFGFSRLSFDEATPIAVIHDALLLDVPPNVELDITPAETVPGLDVRFVVEETVI